MESPHVVIVAGPNGAGKSTAAPGLLRDYLGISEFVNADVIAQGLSAFNPEGAAMQAGRVMLTRMRKLAEVRKSFAFETTLAAKSYATWVRHLRETGYQVYLVFLWVRSADTAIERVAERVRQGGHHIPDEIVRRRYERGLMNLFDVYMPIVDSWILLDNSNPHGYVTVAFQDRDAQVQILDENLWTKIKGQVL